MDQPLRNARSEQSLRICSQLVRIGNEAIRTAFFFPHDTEAAAWWQGEDAQLASLAAAARIAMPLFASDPTFQSELRKYAWDQLHALKSAIQKIMPFQA